MALIETIQTGKEEVKSWPYPPTFRKLSDAHDYLVKLYVALAETQAKGFRGEIFLSTDPPQDFMGQNGDLWIRVPE